VGPGNAERGHGIGKDAFPTITILEKLGLRGHGPTSGWPRTPPLEPQGWRSRSCPTSLAADPKSLPAFSSREAKAVAALNHPKHRHDPLGGAGPAGVHFLTMEPASRAESLDRKIARGGLSFEAFLEIARPLVDRAVRGAREGHHGTRDLKPAKTS